MRQLDPPFYKKAFDLGCKGITTFHAGGKRMTRLKKSAPKTVEPIQQEQNEIAYEMAVGDACTFDPDTGRKSCE